MCLYQQTKTIAAGIVPHLSSALRDLQLGKVLLLFFQALIHKCTAASWHCHYYTILNKLLVLGYIYTFFHDIIFSYYLTAIQTLTFRYINWTPDVAFTGSFLNIVFGRNFWRGMGKKTATKNA